MLCVMINLEVVIILLNFIEETPELFDIAPTLDRGTKTLEYIGNVTINGFPNVEKRPKPEYESTKIPKISQKKINQLFEQNKF